MRDTKKTANGAPVCCLAIILVFGIPFLAWPFCDSGMSPILTVDEVSIVQGYNLTANNHLNAAFNFEVKVYNPNTDESAYYESIEIRVHHGNLDNLAGYDGFHPFIQDHGNVTSLRFGGAVSNMPLFEPPGQVVLGVEIKGKVMVKNGGNELINAGFNAKCYPVVVYFNSTRGFQRTNCDLKLEY